MKANGSEKKEASIMRERKYKISEIVSRRKKQKQKFECKNITVREHLKSKKNNIEQQKGR